MRQYDDPVEVRRGDADDPDQFLWRGRLWKVRAVVAHWVETGPWWQGGRDGATDDVAGEGRRTVADLVAERELWRVEAGRGIPDGRQQAGDQPSYGVFDLSFDWADGRWQLVGCLD